MSGPVGAPVVHGPPAAETAPTPAAKPEAKAPPQPSSTAGGSAGSAGSPASGSKAKPEGSSSGGSGAAPQSSPAGAELPGSVPTGTVARITGLKSAQELNGQLCQLLRPADSGPDRIVVRTRQGEKSLKPANLQFGAASVYPRWAMLAAAVLAVLSFAASFDVLLGSRSAVSSAAVPVLAMVWLVGTVTVQFWVYRPCRTADVWVPSVSELGLYPPLAHGYRFGFLHVALLLATSVWLYSELILPRMDDVPAPGTPWNAFTASEPEVIQEPEMSGHQTAGEDDEASPAQELDEASCRSEGDEASCRSEGGVAGAGRGDGAAKDSSAEGASEAGEAGEGAEDANSTNVTRIPRITGNMSQFLTWAPNRSVTWGYVAAAGVGMQGLVTFDARLSVRSALHLMSMGAFAVGTWQHSMQSSMVMMSPRGRPLVALSDKMRTAVRLRQNITNYGPLVMLGLPLGSQFMNMGKQTQRNQQVKAVNILKESGLLKLVSLLQWALVAIYAVFYSSLCIDFWFASGAE